jgi:lysozyme
MLKTEKLLLFLLVSICLIVTLVLIDALMDPALLIRSVYARINNLEPPTNDNIYQPGVDEVTLQPADQLIEDEIELVINGWELFRSEGFAFEIQYPREVVRKSALNQDAINSGVGLSAGVPVWQFRLNEDKYYQDTNLIEASVLIHVLEGKSQAEQCLTFMTGSIFQTPNQKKDSLPEVEINGISFVRDEVKEGVMGEFYHRIIYRTFQKGACYEITQLLHYRNITLLADDASIAEFNLSDVLAALDSVVETFKFLENEPTFPDVSYPIPKTPPIAAPKSTPGQVDGLDVSHWQGSIGWNKVSNAGYVFTFAKGTEGVGWTDVKFHTNMNEGTAAGVYMGIYHFARPDLGNDAADEANYFLSVAGDYLKSGYMRPVLDLEVGGSLGKKALSNWVLEWMQTVENKTGLEPLIYTNLFFINNYLTDAVTEYDLWIAYWSCEPEPTFYIPPTGKWRDWSFWQYYGPGGCGNNVGYVPGIDTNIDLNIFNGVEAGLQDYDAATTQTWVSLSSDAYFVPTPYYADITGNVNGDFTGLVDFHFWWDCDALEADISLVESACGVLPVPDEGACLKNGTGMRCLGIDNDIQLAEHTYEEIGNYTPKVIAEVGENLVEDRYKITTYNPILSNSFDPTSPVEAPIDLPFLVNGSVDIRTTLPGVLQVSLGDPVSGEIYDSQCQPVAGDEYSTEEFTLSWQETSVGQVIYELATRYRISNDCPISDIDEDDVIDLYVVDWQDNRAVLELSLLEGELIPSGSVHDLGDLETFQSVSVEYLISNPSDTESFQVTGVSFNDLINTQNPSWEAEVPFEVGPGESIPFTFNFEISTTGDFSLRLNLDHTGANPTPFNVQVQGNGVLAQNPLLGISVDPLSPGSNPVQQTYSLTVLAELDAPAEGVLDFSVRDSDGYILGDPVCESVSNPGVAEYAGEISWIETSSGVLDYTIWARYRPLGECPVSDEQENDIFLAYQVNWIDENPEIIMQTDDGTPLPTGTNVQLGSQPAFQTILLEYLLINSSLTTGFELDNLEFGELLNIINPDHNLELPLVVGPGAELPLTISFETENPGEFTFSVDLYHTATNQSPYLLNIEGLSELVTNPILAISPTPASPGQILIGEVFNLDLDVNLDAPVEGSLLIKVMDADEIPLEEPECQVISAPGENTYNYAINWSEDQVILKDYSGVVEYYAWAGCPPLGEPTSSLEIAYQVDWQEDPPNFELRNLANNLIDSDSIVNLGQFEFYQYVVLSYWLHNTSLTSQLDITDIRIENLKNLSEVELSPVGSVTLPPGDYYSQEIAFVADIAGDFSFDLVIEHQGENSSPYRVSFLGNGVITDNPLKFVIPTPPSPVTSLINNDFSLRVDVGIDAPDEGILQVNIQDKATNSLISQECLVLTENLTQARTFTLSWTQSVPGTEEYQLTAQYRAKGQCPVSDTADTDLSQDYLVEWLEEDPIVEIRDINDIAIGSGSIQELGDVGLSQNIELLYTLKNTSRTTALIVDSISTSNLFNLGEVEITPVGPITLAPEEEIILSVIFPIESLADFGLGIVIDHDGTNATPFQFSVQGTGVLIKNPIQSLTAEPASPGSSLLSDPYNLKLNAVVDPPAPGVLEIQLINQNSGLELDNTCIDILDQNGFTQIIDYSWRESHSGEMNYLIKAGYQALGSCPLEGELDAVLSTDYQITWEVESPELIVNRPEGVTIFDGAVDYVGLHDFFRFVEVTYLISNEDNASPLIVNNLQVENLENLREVLIEPALPIEVGPGESQEVTLNFQVLMLEPFSFDLVWDHNGFNPSPYQTSIEGDAELNLGDVPTESWLYRFLDNVIRSGFFLEIPILFN